MEITISDIQDINANDYIWLVRNAKRHNITIRTVLKHNYLKCLHELQKAAYHDNNSGRRRRCPFYSHRKLSAMLETEEAINTIHRVTDRSNEYERR